MDHDQQADHPQCKQEVSEPSVGFVISRAPHHDQCHVEDGKGNGCCQGTHRCKQELLAEYVHRGIEAAHGTSNDPESYMTYVSKTKKRKRPHDEIGSAPVMWFDKLSPQPHGDYQPLYDDKVTNIEQNLCPESGCF